MSALPQQEAWRGSASRVLRKAGTATVAALFVTLAGAGALASAATASDELPTWAELYAQQERNRLHTEAIWPTLVPTAQNLDLSDFGNDRVSQFGGASYLSGNVGFTDAAGPEKVYLQVSGPHRDGLTAEKICQPDNPANTPARCEVRRLADGSEVAVAERESDVGQERPAVTRTATHIRADGTRVTAVARNYVPIPGDGSPDGPVRTTVPLTADQLIALVNDPAYQV